MALTKGEAKSWKKNKEYWQNRLILQDKMNEKNLAKIERELKKVYKQANKDITKELLYCYTHEGDLPLSPSGMYQYEQTLRAIDKVLSEVFEHEERELNEYLFYAYEDVYDSTIKELGINYNTINNDNVKKAVETNWSGLTFSERIWGKGNARDILAKNIKEELTKGLIRGDSLQDISNKIVDKMNNSFKNSMRLIRTESCHILSQATLDSFKDSKLVEEYEFSAFLDSKTSPQCREMDGVIIKIENGIAGKNLPPLHPHCRSCILPVLSWEEDKYEGKKLTDPSDNIKATKKTKSKSKGTKVTKTSGIKGTGKVNNNKVKDNVKKSPKKFISYGDWQEVQASEVSKLGLSYVEKISEDEYNSLRRYTGSSYSDINNQLRRGHDNGEEKTIKTISRAIKKYKAPEDFMVHRGTSKRAIKKLFGSEEEFNKVYDFVRSGQASKEYLQEKFVGGVIVDKGFASTSVLEASAFSKPVQMHINIEKGSKYGAYINELSRFKDKEYEFLLDKNLATEIYNAEVDEHNRLVLYLNIIGYDK